jgi:hypothetical protein
VGWRLPHRLDAAKILSRDFRLVAGIPPRIPNCEGLASGTIGRKLQNIEIFPPVLEKLPAFGQDRLEKGLRGRLPALAVSRFVTIIEPLRYKHLYRTFRRGLFFQSQD